MGGIALDRITDAPPLESIEGNPEDLRQEIEYKKEAIAETLSRLDQRLHRAVDWRAQVGDHPFLALGVAIGVGCLFSGVFSSKPSPQERIMDALADGVDDIVDDVRDRIASALSWPVGGGVIKATAAAFATRAATNYLSDKLSNTAKS